MDKVFTRIQVEKLQEEFDNAVELLEAAGNQLKEKDEAITKLQETITALTQENNSLNEKLEADFDLEEYKVAIENKSEYENKISDLTDRIQKMETSVQDFEKKVNMAVLEKLASQGVTPVETDIQEDVTSTLTFNGVTMTNIKNK